MIILVGSPGSGKSTLSAMLAPCGFVTVNQDTMGSRKACVRGACAALRRGHPIIVVMSLPPSAPVSNGCGLPTLWWFLDVSLDVCVCVCVARVNSRTGHPTLPPGPESEKVVRRIRGNLVPPSAHEGFGAIVTLRTVDVHGFAAAMCAHGSPAARSTTSRRSSRSCVAATPQVGLSIRAY